MGFTSATFSLLNEYLAMIAALAVVWIAAWSDLRTYRIPNLLTVSGALLGLLIHISDTGWSGLWQAVSGFGLAVILLIPGYILKATAAGDLKLMAAIGSILGPQKLLCAIINIFLVAGVFGATIGLLAWRMRGATGPWKRYGKMLRFFITTGRPTYLRPSKDEAMARQMPLAVPIAIGTTASMLYPVKSLCPAFF